MTAATENVDDSQLYNLRNFGLFLAGALLLWGWPVFFAGETFIYRDFGYFGYPLAVHHREAFWRGEIPLWNPLNHCGIPFLAQWNTLVLYPGSLIYLLLPAQFSLSLFTLFHVWLAGVGMFLLARAWYRNGFAAALAGIGFAVSGLSLNFLLWPNNAAALAWMPFVIHFGLERRNFVRAAAVGAMQMLTGAPEVILLTWGAFFVLAALQRNIVRFVMLGLVVACICAVQLLPFLDLVKISQRHRDYGNAVWALPLWGGANFFVPKFFTYELSSGVRFQYDQLWTSSFYPSILITIFALFSWKRGTVRERALLIISILAVLLAFGPAGQIHTFFKSIVPGFGFIRFPIKFVVLASFALPLLAASAIAPEKRARVLCWIGLAAVVGGIVVYARNYPKFDPPFDNWPLTMRSGLLALAIAAAGLLLWDQPRRRAGILLLIPLDIFLQVGNPTPAIARDALAPLTQPYEGRAMLTRHAWELLYLETFPNTYTNFALNRLALNVNLNLLENSSKVDGFFSLNMAESQRLRDQLYAKGQENLGPIMDFMGITRVSAPGKVFDWVDRTNAMPLVTAGQAPRVLESSNVLGALFSVRFDPRKMILLDAPAPGYDTNAVEAAVSNLRRSRGKISFDVSSAAPSFAVIAEAHHPNWRVRLNGNAHEKLRANFAFMGIPIPKGNSHIDLEYDDTAFKLGSVISIAALAALFLKR